jgi:hypothetical protein
MAKVREMTCERVCTQFDLHSFLSYPLLSSGGAPGSVFFTKRYALGSGLNSSNLDFLPIQNIEDVDVVISGLGAVPVGK